MKWEKFQMLHAVFVLAKLNAKWGGMIKSLVSRVGSVVGGSQFIWLCNLPKGFSPSYTHTHTLVHIKNERKGSLSIFLSELKCQVESL